MAIDPQVLLHRARGAARRGWERLRGSGGPVERFARVAAASLVALYLLYLGVANVALWARVLPDYLADHEEPVRIDYASAWTFWPGRLAVRDVVVASQDSTIELEIRAAEASSGVGLLALLDKRIELSGLRARDVSVRIRGRRAEAEAVADRRRLPPMATWGPLAVRDPTPPPPTDPEKLWHIVLEDTEGTVREVWVEGVRVTGELPVRGRFDFRPMLHVVTDVRGQVRGGAVAVMGEDAPPAARDVEALFRFHVPGFEVPPHELPEILRFADVDLEGSAMIRGSALVRAVADDVDAVDGSGPLEVRLAARQGRLLRDSSVEHRAARLDLTAGDATASLRDTRLTVRATTDEDVTLDVAAAAIHARVPSRSTSDIFVESPSASMDARLVPHFFDPSFEGGEVSIPASNMALAGLDGVVDAIRVRGGVGYLRARAEVERDGVGSGEVHVLLDGVDGAIFGVALAGRSRTELQLDELRLGDVTTIRSTGFVTLDELAMTAGDEDVKGWWGRIELSSDASREGDAPWSVDADLTARLQDTRPAVAILDGGGFVPGIVADQLFADGFVVDGAIHKRGPRTQIDVDDAVGNGVRVRGRLVDAAEELRGSFLVETSIVDVGVSLVRGDTQFQVLAGEDWLARERRFLGGFAAEEAAPHPAAPTVR